MAGKTKPVPIELLQTGVPNLDAVLGGGLPAYSLSTIAGPAGSGETTLAQQIKANARGFGWDFAPPVMQGKVHFYVVGTRGSFARSNHTANVILRSDRLSVVMLCMLNTMK